MAAEVEPLCKKAQQLPSEVTCPECHNKFGHLWTHFKFSHGTSTEELIEQQKLDSQTPLHSSQYSQYRHQAGKDPGNEARLKAWAEGLRETRRKIVRNYAEIGIFTSYTASEFTGVPPSTFTRAVREERLAALRGPLTYQSEEGVRRLPGVAVALINQADLINFLQHSKSRRLQQAADSLEKPQSFSP